MCCRCGKGLGDVYVMTVIFLMMVKAWKAVGCVEDLILESFDHLFSKSEIPFLLDCIQRETSTELQHVLS